MKVADSQRVEIESQAAEWVIRLGDGRLQPDERAALETWLEQSPLHKEAFYRAQATWSDLGKLRRVGSLTSGAQERPFATSSAPVRYLPTLALAAALLIAIGLASFFVGDIGAQFAADYHSNTGQLLSAVLPDGTKVELGGASALTLRFNNSERRVELLSGEAYFAVAPQQTGGETRPFVVQAANGSARAVGSELTINRMAAAVEVTALEDKVEVSASTSSRPEGEIVTVSQGQSVRYDRSSGFTNVQSKDVERATAWRRGRLIFDRANLSDVIEELNRYRRGWILVTNSGLRQRVVSGVFLTADAEGALQSITEELNLHTISISPYLTVLY